MVREPARGVTSNPGRSFVGSALAKERLGLAAKDESLEPGAERAVGFSRPGDRLDVLIEPDRRSLDPGSRLAGLPLALQAHAQPEPDHHLGALAPRFELFPGL